MGYIIYSLVVAFALFGSIASGNKRDKRGGITVVSGVDESGKEYGGIYRFSDDGPGLFNRFGDDEPVVFDNPFRPTNNFDYNTFLNNYISIFSNMVRVPPTYGGSSSHASAGFGTPNAFDEDFHRQFAIQFNNNNFPWNLQNNMEVLQKVNEAAVNAANNIAATNGFEFNYKPGPEPDFAFATGSVDPRETYVKTEINKPNQDKTNLASRFSDDSDAVKFNNNEETDKDDTAHKEQKTGAGDKTAAAPKKPKINPFFFPDIFFAYHKAAAGATLNSRFGEDDEEKNKFINSLKGLPKLETSEYKVDQDKEPGLSDRFAFADDDDKGTPQAVQAYISFSDAALNENDPGTEAELITTVDGKVHKRYPNLNNRFQNPESDPSRPHFQSIQAFASTSSLNDNGKKSSSRRAEVITNLDGHVQRYLTKDP